MNIYPRRWQQPRQKVYYSSKKSSFLMPQWRERERPAATEKKWNKIVQQIASGWKVFRLKKNCRETRKMQQEKKTCFKTKQGISHSGCCSNINLYSFGATSSRPSRLTENHLTVCMLATNFIIHLTSSPHPRPDSAIDFMANSSNWYIRSGEVVRTHQEKKGKPPAGALPGCNSNKITSAAPLRLLNVFRLLPLMSGLRSGERRWPPGSLRKNFKGWTRARNRLWGWSQQDTAVRPGGSCKSSEN